jgi:hypothetical protein
VVAAGVAVAAAVAADRAAFRQGDDGGAAPDTFTAALPDVDCYRRACA